MATTESGVLPDMNSTPQPLTDAEVQERVRSGRANVRVASDSRSVVSILRTNILTRFNAIISVMLVVVLVFGEPADALFGLVMVINALIGIVQELRAKRTLDRLTVLIEPKAVVVRESGIVEISADDIVLDDLIQLARGYQIPVDGRLVEADALEISEALLTGEADPIEKRSDEGVLSGSFVVAGTATYIATAVGAESYANRLAAEAKKFAVAQSGVTVAINKILRIVTWLLLPTSILLVWSQLQSGQSLPDAAVAAVAGVVAMVPQGLVLLVSMALAVAVIRLGKRNVLVQELPAVETLARVDLLCVDKTGTLTSGEIVLAGVEPLGDDPIDAGLVLAAIATADPDPNPTMQAITAKYPKVSRSAVEVEARVAFSSERKTSAVAFSDGTAWIVGAPDVVMGEREDEGLQRRVAGLSGSGHRAVLVATASHESIVGGDAVALEPVLLLDFTEEVRPDAAQTLQFFADQSVEVKVISGDSADTVAAVAAEAGVPGTTAIDARGLSDIGSADFDEEVRDVSIFGRVVPEQKRALVQTFRREGRVVAMTGDGVNDVLALKDADLGIAMGSGSGATRAVSQLVLLDDRFASLPYVVAEGRRVVANMERVASLFLTKTVYAMLLAVLIGFVGLAFPFLPRHLTLIGSITIGIPAFFLSFEPREQPIRPGFLPRVLAFAVPAGLVSGVATFSLYGVSRLDYLGLTLEQSRSAATTMMVALGLVVLYELIEPLDFQHVLLIGGLFTMYLLIIAIPPAREFFGLLVPTWQAWAVIAVVSLLAGVLLKALIAASRDWVATRYAIDPV